MSGIEIAGFIVTTLSIGYSIFLNYSNKKLQSALEKEQSLSNMWQKTADSVFMMAQKGQL